jgi:DNA-binding NarL/FixJ family response regulator
MTRPTNVFNPLGLTARQLQIVDALIRLGQNKLVCLELNIKPSAVSIVIDKVSKRLGVHGPVLLAVEMTKLQIGHEMDLALREGA